LNNFAASAASTESSGSGFGKICRAMDSAVASSGPHKNSAHATLLTLKFYRAEAHERNCSCADEPATVV
jgi:hypothetical protein